MKFILVASVGLALLVGCSPSTDQAPVSLSHGRDLSAGDLPCYIITTETTTFYLEKQGGGLSSMIDSDGVDWLGFHDEEGSGWKGEYRGFPNSIHRQDGSYFHALNAGTELSSSVVEIETENHVRIIFTSGNGKWKGQWGFYPDRCDFTMTEISPGWKYWILYEGVPGGEMDDTDFWYFSGDSETHAIDETHPGDFPDPEWIAFGDVNSPRMIYLLHHEDNDHPDTYLNRPYMTVLGFGRFDGEKFFDTPQTVSIGFAESTDYQSVKSTIEGLLK